MTPHHPKPILVWRWADAPDFYRELSSSPRGAAVAEYTPSDSDLVVFVPDIGTRPDLGWLDSLGSDVYEFDAINGILFCVPGRRE